MFNSFGDIKELIPKKSRFLKIFKYFLYRTFRYISTTLNAIYVKKLKKNLNEIIFKLKYIFI